MKVVLSNEDARRLRQQIEQNPTAALDVQAVAVGQKITATITVGDLELSGEVARTPYAPRMFIVEDADGNLVARGEG
jgi:hypothetical protein